MQNQMIELRNTNYYMIINKATGFSLYLPSQSKDFQKEKIYLSQPSQADLGHVWMIVPKYVLDCPYCFHTCYYLVEEFNEDIDRQMEIQSIILSTKTQSEKRQKQSNKYLTYDKQLLIRETGEPNQQSIWQLVLVHHNDTINRSCYIEYAHSNMVLDVPKASEKSGVHICQYPCNNRFNQRWNLIKQGQNKYWIQNLKTRMFLDIKGESKKSGGSIIQWSKTGGINQLWILEYQGKGIYLIRSAMEPKLLLSVKDNSLKQCADIVTTDDDGECLWRIVGHIPS